MARTGINIALAALALGLGGGLAAEIAAERPAPVRIAPPPAEVSAERIVLAVPRLAAFQEIARRPVFHESRRPPAAAAAPAEARAAPPPDLRLLGLARGAGAGRAIVATAAGRTEILSIGEEIGGWRLAAISGDAAVFAREGARHRVHLDPEGAAREPAPAPADAAPLPVASDAEAARQRAPIALGERDPRIDIADLLD